MLTQALSTLFAITVRPFSIMVVGNQIADSVRLRGPLNPDDDRAQMDQICGFVLG
jgi:hypothetical protein